MVDQVMDGLLVVVGAGVLAGLGVAVPLGAIGALLVREGLVFGFRVAASAAAGIAAVDTLYCATAMTAGAALAPRIESHRGIFLVVSGLVLMAIGVRQLVAGVRRTDIDGLSVETPSGLSTFARFVGLTAVNPVTLVYFAALAGVVTSHGGGWLAPVAFVAAVGLSSLAWQLVLAAVGAVFRRSVTARAAHRITIAAATLVIGLGASVTVAGIT